jgi:hypothetical protein
MPNLAQSSEFFEDLCDAGNMVPEMEPPKISCFAGTFSRLVRFGLDGGSAITCSEQLCGGKRRLSPPSAQVAEFGVLAALGKFHLEKFPCRRAFW